jgi:CHAT domain-containing protein/tetratricopeptide (TPR) repeat protein
MRRGKNDAADRRREVRLVGMTVAAILAIVFRGVSGADDRPSKTTPTGIADPNRQMTLAELPRLTKAAQQLEAKGKLAEAIAAWEELVVRARPLVGEVSEPIARFEERLAQLHQKREEWQAAQQARGEVLAIRAKLYGETDWRVTNSRWALRDVEIQARLTPGQRRELLEAGQADSQGVLFYRKGEFRRAAPFAECALEIRRRILGETHPAYAESLGNLALLYKSQADYARAEPLYRQALEIRKQALGETHPDCAVTLNNLAALYESKGDYARAEPLYLQALEIRKKALGETHPRYATSLNNLACIYQSRGDYARAEPLLRQALEIRKNALGEMHLDYAGSLDSLAALYRNQADYARAEPMYRQALDIVKKVLGETHPDYATSLNNLAALYRSQGHYARAEPLYRHALEIYKKALGERHPDYATGLNNLADLYWSQGDYARAEPLFRRALEIRKIVLGETHPAYAAGLNNLGELYRSQGDYARAEPLYRQALEICKKTLGERHPDYAQSLGNLAAVYDSQRDFARAEPLYRQAAEIRKKVLGDRHPDYAASLNNLAVMYVSQRDYARAEPLYRQALEIDKKALGEGHPDYATNLNNLAVMYDFQGDYTRAEPLLRRALEIRKKVLGETHPDYANSLGNLAGLYHRQGDYVRAEPLLRQVLDIYERHFTNTLNAQSERQQLALAKILRLHLDTYLSIAPEVRARADVVYRHVLGWKGAVFMRQFASRAARTEPELKSLFEELETVSVRLSNLAFSVPDPKRREVWQRQTVELSDRKEALERELSTKSAAFRQQQALLELTPDELRKVVPHNAALVDVLEYTQFSLPAGGQGKFRNERRLAAFVVRPDAEVKRIDLGPAAPIATAISAWREGYGQPGVSNPGKDLRALVWEPLAPLLTGAETILFSPDGALCRFPLAALPGEKPDTYLLEERNILIMPVPRLLPPLLASAGSESADGKTNAALLIGDVDFGGEPGIVSLANNDGAVGREEHRSAARWSGQGQTVFGRLPGTAQEVEAIRILYEGPFGPSQAQVIMGSKATEQVFRTEAPRHRFIHLATHGFFAPENVRSGLDVSTDDQQRAPGELFGSAKEVRGFHPGLLSGIALAGANGGSDTDGGINGSSGKEADDGVLTALEVAGLDLRNVDLVVLSACETGLGRVAGGEGVLGLQRAFQLAGAKSVVASLWKVDDRATVALMRVFYHKLWVERKSAAVALREAQLALLRHPDEIESLATTRGPNFEKTVKLMNHGERTPRVKTTSPRIWAAFVISGSGI